MHRTQRLSAAPINTLRASGENVSLQRVAVCTVYSRWLCVLCTVALCTSHGRDLHLVDPSAAGSCLGDCAPVGDVTLLSLQAQDVEEHQAELLAKETVEQEVGGRVNLHHKRAQGVETLKETNKNTLKCIYLNFLSYSIQTLLSFYTNKCAFYSQIVKRFTSFSVFSVLSSETEILVS